jgi:hypothetical protein
MDAGLSDRTPAVSLSDFSQAELVAYLRALVAHIQHEDALLSRFFEFRSAIYLEPMGRDAHAKPGKINSDGSRQVGSMTLGLGFLQVFAPQPNSASISGIMAHEKSHVFQYLRRINGILEDLGGHEVKYVELHADYLAGAYMAWRERNVPVKAGEVSQTIYDLGDRDVNHRLHHGTKQERLYAYSNGYYQFLGLKDQGLSENVETAARMGMRYVCKALSIC